MSVFVPLNAIVMVERLEELPAHLAEFTTGAGEFLCDGDHLYGVREGSTY